MAVDGKKSRWRLLLVKDSVFAEEFGVIIFFSYICIRKFNNFNETSNDKKNNTTTNAYMLDIKLFRSDEQQNDL